MSEITIVDFYTSWCGQCKKVKPIIQELTKDYKVLFIDAEEDKDSVEKYQIGSLPTILILKDDVEVGRLIGLFSKKMLLDKIESCK